MCQSSAPGTSTEQEEEEVVEERGGWREARPGPHSWPWGSGGVQWDVREMRREGLQGRDAKAVNLA